MNLIINGKSETINEQYITVSDLLKIKNVEMPDTVTVELNGEILEKENYNSQKVSDNDKIEFLYFMGGGY
jgi:sulfur carrier protein